MVVVGAGGEEPQAHCSVIGTPASVFWMRPVSVSTQDRRTGPSWAACRQGRVAPVHEGGRDPSHAVLVAELVEGPVGGRVLPGAHRVERGEGSIADGLFEAMHLPLEVLHVGA